MPDAIEDTELVVDLNGEIVLPETVNAVMTDNSRQAVPVSWEIDEARLRKMAAGGPAKYEIIGEAGGMEARCFLSIVAYNYLRNPGFEDGTEEPWIAADLGKTEQLYAEEKATDSLSGSWHYHFWSAAQNSVAFTLEQKVEGLRGGTYQYEISIMGGDCGETEIYAYVKLDGEIVGRAPMKISGYGNWDTGSIGDIAYEEGRELVVGIYVKCAGEGNGAWGKIDDAAALHSVG